MTMDRSYGRRRVAAWLMPSLTMLLACVWAGIAVLAGARPVRALEIEFSGRPVKLDILALYDSRHEARPSDSRIHRLAEMPLNWLGFKLTYVDVNGELPTPEASEAYRGVITWFIEPLQDPSKVLGWLDGVAARGVRYVCLGEVAPPEPPSATFEPDAVVAKRVPSGPRAFTDTAMSAEALPPEEKRYATGRA